MSKKTRPRVRQPGWTLILVPPKPGARTREVTVSTRSLMSVGSVALLLFAGAATYTGETSSFAAATADRLAESQRTVVGLLDSVQYLGALAARAAKLPPKDMIMPVAAGHITSGYNSSRLHPILDIFRAHKGVDVAANAGTRIVSPAAGRVKSVGWRFGYGLTVEIQHTGDVVTLFAHCQQAFVHVGDNISSGQIIASVGSSGLATGPHVHFEVISRGRSVDPIKFLAASRDSATQARALYGVPKTPKTPAATVSGGTNDGGSLDSPHR
jgi:murein DD-endopeptidase MepM/ murein hydrolase activator NlpD